MDKDKLATERVRKARAELIMSHVFYSVLVSNVEPVLSRKFPTMATDGKRHYYNPDYIATLSQKHLLAVQAHESEHDARRHHSRRNGRDPAEWNRCTDYAINIDLVDAGFELPPDALIDPKYRGMSAEDIYRTRELDRQKQQLQQQQDDDEQDDESEDSEPEAEEQSEAEDNEPEGEDDRDEAADGDSGEGQTSCGDPGGMGEVLDAADAAAELAAADSQWETIFRQAAFLAERRGDLPGHVTREVERADKPPQDWRETLRAWFDGGATKIETWSRPNRRFAGAGVYLPGQQRDGVNLAVFLIDTSGSMDPIALACIRTETQAALDEHVIDEVVVVYGDTRVTRVDNYRHGDEIEFDPRGGGGTDLRPLFRHVAEEIEDASLIVCFTDGFIGDPGPEPHCPVLFAATGYPDRVRRYLAEAPWNAPGIDVGSH